MFRVLGCHARVLARCLLPAIRYSLYALSFAAVHAAFQRDLRLDSLLRGGLVEGRLYLVIGPPGTGKTLLGTQFLEAGLEAGDDVLFIHAEESAADLLANTAELGIDIADATFLDVGPDSEFFMEPNRTTWSSPETSRTAT